MIKIQKEQGVVLNQVGSPKVLMAIVDGSPLTKMVRLSAKSSNHIVLLNFGPRAIGNQEEYFFKLFILIRIANFNPNEKT